MLLGKLWGSSSSAFRKILNTQGGGGGADRMGHPFAGKVSLEARWMVSGKSRERGGGGDQKMVSVPSSVVTVKQQGTKEEL